MKPPSENARCVSLPYDVLLIIFKRATSVPNAFDIHEPDLFAYPAPWSQEKIQAALFKSMYTKYHLALVCKAWNDVATPLLYQSICISKRKSLMALLRSLQATLTDGRNESGDMAESISSSSKGKWTKRLDILFRGETSIQASAFARLFKCLPNLQIIVQRGKTLIIKRSSALLSIFVVLPELVTRSLHVLDTKCQFDTGPFNNDAYPDATSITNAIGNQPLHTLKVFPVSEGLILVKHYAFLSYLECLDAPRHFTERILACTGTASKLTRIALLHERGNGLDSLRKCFPHIGAGLGQLQLQIATSNPTYIQQFLYRVANFCPNLHNLVVPLDDGTVRALSGYFAPVRNLGIHPRLSLWDREWCSEQSTLILWESFCSKLMEVIPEMPNLRIVRLLDELPHQNIDKDDPFFLKATATSKMLMQGGVRLEDCTGQIFHKN